MQQTTHMRRPAIRPNLLWLHSRATCTNLYQDGKQRRGAMDREAFIDCHKHERGEGGIYGMNEGVC